MPTQNRSIHPLSIHKFCVRVVSLGVQLAIVTNIGAAWANNAQPIKRTPHPTVNQHPFLGNFPSEPAKQPFINDPSVDSFSIFGTHYPSTDTSSLTKDASTDISSYHSSVANQTPIARQPANPISELHNKRTLSSLYQRQKNSCQGVWHYPKIANHGNGLTARADYGYYDNDTYGELLGNVEISQADNTLFANQVRFNPTTGQVNAGGNVLFNGDDGNNDMIGMAQKLEYNLHTKRATALDVAFASNRLHAHGHAGKLTNTDPNRTILTHTSFSTCPPDRRHWEILSDEITLDQTTGRGIAKHTTLKIRNKTVAKLPYFNFPIDDRRSSGFLLPNVGINSKDGLEVSLPYYFNLAPNYDATVTPTIFGNKNPRVAGEFRYLTHHYGQGKLQGAILPSDRKYDNKTRGHLFFDHFWQATDATKAQLGLDNTPHPIDNLTLSATYRHISDGDYLTDFDKLGVANNALNLPRRIELTYATPNTSANLKVETFQKLNGNDENGQPFLDKNRPYARLPQLSVSYQMPAQTIAKHTPSWVNANTLSITGTHDLAYFKRSIKDNSDSEKSGVRLYNDISASYPMTASWGYIHPKVSLSHLLSAYDEDSLDDQNLSKQDGLYAVFVPTFSVDTGLHFYKKGTPFGWANKTAGGYQLISPRLKYRYSPHQDQQAIPNFDTSLASLSYDQLLADSWFLGYDRLPDLHTITPALNYRYIDNTGQTLVEFGVAEQFFLDDVKVSLDNVSPANSGVKKGAGTGISWQASVSPMPNLWLNGAGSLTKNYRFNTLLFSARYQPNERTLLNVGMVNRKAFGQLPLTAYTGSAIFSINPQWQVVAQAQYDAKHQKFLDTLVGVNYEDCCVGISLYGREFRNDLRPSDPPNRAVMAELRLSGLTGKGQLNRLLSDKIFGFDNIADSWRPKITHTHHRNIK